MIQIYFGVLAAAAMMLVGGYIFVTLNKKYPKSIGLLLGLSGGFLLGIIFFGIIPEAHEILELSLIHIYTEIHCLCKQNVY